MDQIEVIAFGKRGDDEAYVHVIAFYHSAEVRCRAAPEGDMDIGMGGREALDLIQQIKADTGLRGSDHQLSGLEAGEFGNLGSRP